MILRTRYLYVRVILLLVVLATKGLDSMAAIRPIEEKLHYPQLTTAFCKKNPSFWTVDNENSLKLRRQLIKLIESSPYKGLDRERFHPSVILAFGNRSDGEVKDHEAYFTDALITYCKDLVKLPEIGSGLKYDDVSAKFSKKEELELMRRLMTIKDDSDLKTVVATLEPNDRKYKTLLDGYAEQLKLEDRNEDHLKKIRAGIAYYRWLHHFKLDRYIVINIAAARLRYYEDGDTKLTMKIVAGENGKATPRFAAWCDQITLYPYWNVPKSIAVNEILPFCQQNAADIDSLNMDVIDSKGQTVKPSSVKWHSYTAKNFPYRFRQSPGCDNPLGLIKFNLTDPFDIYMHDTNVKRAFKSKKRYYSHGCIRLEKPDALANMFLKDKLEENFLENCPENPQPRVQRITPVPVFIVYIPAEASEANSITIYDDVYELL